MRREQARTERPSAGERPQGSGEAPLGRGGRMSRRAQTGRGSTLLRGEDLETVSRSLGVMAATLSEHELLAPARAGSPRRPRNHDGTIIPHTVGTI